jgi:hypothetical protein
MSNGCCDNTQSSDIKLITTEICKETVITLTTGLKQTTLYIPRNNITITGTASFAFLEKGDTAPDVINLNFGGTNPNLINLGESKLYILPQAFDSPIILEVDLTSTESYIVFSFILSAVHYVAPQAGGETEISTGCCG